VLPATSVFALVPALQFWFKAGIVHGSSCRRRSGLENLERNSLSLSSNQISCWTRSSRCWARSPNQWRLREPWTCSP